jgi:N4-gp56 family major capsid protein
MKRKNFILVPLTWFATTDTSNLTGIVRTAYSKAVEFAFNPNLYFAQFAQAKRWRVGDADPMPGNPVSFTIFGALAVTSTALGETADPTAETMTVTQKTITLSEYGKRITTTQKLRTTSFANIDLSVGRLVGDNMGRTVDLIARQAYDVGTAAANISYASGSSAASVLATSTLKAAKVRYAFNRLARANVPKFDGRYYIAVCHPDCIYDLRSETGAGSWRQPKEYVDPTEIYNGEIGEFEGFRFVSTTNAKITTDGASGTVDLYTNYFIGFQAVGYAEGLAPTLGMSGPFDALQRLMNVYWYGLFGFGPLRADSLHKVYSASSVGANT